jgi:NADPH2:quinone reductase
LYPRKVPFICGQEGGGSIDSISLDESSSTSEFKIGDKVVYSSFQSYAEYTLVPISKLIAVPKSLDIRKAITCMVQGLTAHYLLSISSAHMQTHALKTNNVKDKDWILIYSVGSGTCQWAAQMAKIRGYRVIGTCSKGKVQQASGVGCDELIVLDEVDANDDAEEEAKQEKNYSNYHSVDIARRVMEATDGKGVKCVIDGIGKSTSDISLSCLSRRGIFISFGNASGKVDDLSLLKLVGKSAFVTRPKLGDYVSTREELLERINEVFEWVLNGDLDVCIDQEFDLSDVVHGHQYIEAGKSRGKLLFKI